MILDMHCHTTEHSHCSHVTAADLVQSNCDKGLQGTVLTDHHYLWPEEEIRELRSGLKVPDYYLILSGQEVETPELGHVLVYGAGESLGPGTSLEDIRRRFPDAAIIWAHPYRNENVPTREKLQHPLIDGIEIFSSNHTVSENNRALRDWHQYKFIALSGSDTHAVSYSGVYPTLFDHPLTGIAELAGEIRAGRCRPYFEEIPRSGTSSTRVTEVAIGTGGARKAADKFVIRSLEDTDTWRSAERSRKIIEQISRHGFEKGRYRVPKQFGQDEKSRSVFEQAINGKTLFDAIVESPAEDARLYLRMAAEWLARLHNARLRITPGDEFIHEEPNRLEYYLSAFYRVNHRHTRAAQEILDRVIEMETALYCKHPEKMIQGHGDYHPKNIFIGHEDDAIGSSPFVAAIDFNSSYTMPPAFDVGTFLAQFRNMFYGNRDVLSKAPADIFLETYLKQASGVGSDFFPQVELFKARTAMSICYYLIKVGFGESENLWRVLVEAGRTLTRLSVESVEASSRIEKTGNKRKR